MGERSYQLGGSFGDAMRAMVRQSLFLTRSFLFLVLLSWIGAARPAAAQCLAGLCTGDLTTGQCGIGDTSCVGRPSDYPVVSTCAGNGCNFVNNCRLPIVTGPTR